MKTFQVYTLVTEQGIFIKQQTAKQVASLQARTMEEANKQARLVYGEKAYAIADMR